MKLRPDSGHHLPVQSTSTVQTLDALIPARALVPSRAAEASRAEHFMRNTQNTQLHSLLHINLLWLATSIKQALFDETVFC